MDVLRIYRQLIEDVCGGRDYIRPGELALLFYRRYGVLPTGGYMSVAMFEAGFMYVVGIVGLDDDEMPECGGMYFRACQQPRLV